MRGRHRDVSADALAECRRQAGPMENVAPLACVVGDALHIPLASQSVDVVMTRSVLIYLADKQAGVHELYRVLTPEGRASIFASPSTRPRSASKTRYAPADFMTSSNRSGARFARTTMRTRRAGGQRS